MARKDNKGRNLKTGEYQRPDGRYEYRYKDEITGKRNSVYAADIDIYTKQNYNIKRKHRVFTGLEHHQRTAGCFFARVTSTGLENTMPEMNVIFSALTEWVLISPDPQVYLQDCKVPIVFCLSVTEPV